MGVNVLGRRKTARLAAVVGRPVVWAWVGEEGRWAFCTTVDHVHLWVDRRTGAFEVGDLNLGVKVSTFQSPCPSSCRILFEGDPSPAAVLVRVARMRDPDSWERCPVAGCGADGWGEAQYGRPMLCRGYGSSDRRCRADWASVDPEDRGSYAAWLAEDGG